MPKTIDVVVPDIGDFESVDVIEVLVAVGDQVGFEDSLITLESDKATMEIPSPAAGVLAELKVEVGSKVSEGDVIAVIGAESAEVESPPVPDAETDSDSDSEPEPEPEPEPDSEAEPKSEEQPETEPEQKREPEPETKPAPRPAAASSVSEAAAAEGGSSYASPAVRRLARELEVNLARIQGTGRKGRVSKEDLHNHIKSLMKGSDTGGGGIGLNVAPPPKVNFEKFGEIELQPLSRIKKISGPALHRNWVSIPHVTQNDEADITEMEAFPQREQGACGIQRRKAHTRCISHESLRCSTQGVPAIQRVTFGRRRGIGAEEIF